MADITLDVWITDSPREFVQDGVDLIHFTWSASGADVGQVELVIWKWVSPTTGLYGQGSGFGSSGSVSWYLDSHDGSLFDHEFLNLEYWATDNIGTPDQSDAITSIFNKPNYLKAILTPTSDFTSDLIYTEVNNPVQFTDQSTNDPNSWAWDFGDLTTSNEQNPIKEYTTPGIYTVSLQSFNKAGNDMETKTNYIEIIDSIFPVEKVMGVSDVESFMTIPSANVNTILGIG